MEGCLKCLTSTLLFLLQAELTALQIIEVAKRLAATMKVGIKEVGLRLGLDDFVIDGILGCGTNLTQMAHEVLGAWRGTVATPRDAYWALREALLDSGRRKIVQEVLECTSIQISAHTSTSHSTAQESSVTVSSESRKSRAATAAGKESPVAPPTGAEARAEAPRTTMVLRSSKSRKRGSEEETVARPARRRRGGRARPRRNRLSRDQATFGTLHRNVTKR